MHGRRAVLHSARQGPSYGGVELTRASFCQLGDVFCSYAATDHHLNPLVCKVNELSDLLLACNRGRLSSGSQDVLDAKADQDIERFCEIASEIERPVKRDAHGSGEFNQCSSWW